MSAERKCVVEGCDQRAFYKSAQLCKTCYHGMYYWKDRTPTDVLRRRKQLMRLQSRMEMLTPNVRTFKAKRKAAK